MRANPPRILTLCAAIFCLMVFGSARFVSKVQAYPSGSPAGYTGAPTSAVDSGTCSSCHGGTPTAGGVTVTGFPSGNTYTPGVTQHLTVTVPSTTSGRGFELTARLASNTLTPEGTLTSTDGNTQVISSGIAGYSNVKFVGQTLAGSSMTNTFHFDWTPPSTSVGDIAFYVAGVSGFSNVSTNSYTLTAAATAPTLSTNPSSLQFSYQSGSATMPGPQTFAVSSSDGSAVNFSASASGGTWLTLSPSSGTTGSSTTNTLTVSVNPAGLAPGTYTGTLTVSSSGASNTPTVGVTLVVTSAATLSVSPGRLTFSPQNNFAAQQVNVNSSGGSTPFTVSVKVLTPTGGTWLSASCPANPCTTPAAVTVSADRASLTSGGNYYGTIIFTPTDPSMAAITIPAKIRVPKH